MQRSAAITSGHHQRRPNPRRQTPNRSLPPADPSPLARRDVKKCRWVIGECCASSAEYNLLISRAMLGQAPQSSIKLRICPPVRPSGVQRTVATASDRAAGEPCTMNFRWMDSRRSDIWLLTRTDREALALDPCCSPLPRAALVPHGENLQASVTVRLVARPSSSSFADTSIGAGPSGVHLASCICINVDADATPPCIRRPAHGGGFMAGLLSSQSLGSNPDSAAGRQAGMMPAGR